MAIIRCIDKQGGTFSVSPEVLVSGFMERGTYYFEIVPESRLFVDDEPLAISRHEAFDAWRWEPGFYAGKVIAELVSAGGKLLATYHFDVAADQNKLGELSFAAMLDELLAFDTRLLMGNEYAQLEVGREGRTSNPHLQYARLKRYGPALLSAFAEVVRKPLTRLHRERTLRPAHQLRRIDRQTLRRALQDPAATALLYKPEQDRTSSELLQFDVPTVFENLDNPANQALAVVLGETLRRSRHVIAALQAIIEKERDTGARSALAPRLGRRIEFLEGLHRDLRRIQRIDPFRSLRQPRISAAGLNAISAHPTYARAYRHGWYVLRPGIDGSSEGERMWISPTWEIYERWCYLQVVAVIKSIYPNLQWCDRWPGSRMDVIRCEGRSADIRVDVLLQVRCPAFDQPASHGFSSISGERYPDIVVTVESPAGNSFIVMDAKYRVERKGVLESMVSAHVYRDCLRWKGLKPDLSILLVPRAGGAPLLETPTYQKTNGVGVAVLSVGQNRLLGVLSPFLIGCTGSNTAGPHMAAMPQALI
ncbi:MULTISPECIES: DUF2357 domain-containing protein [Pseudomonas]|uniref:DUF2357 domain-containing protein n=1 Tax=Pseudomonas TaxID=286 RepID=UPI000CFFF904|nr:MULTISPECIES: DUF2357 domain-containing protein [Pseudomonas]PRA52568.1 hypothetical protein CQZ98_16510 [Pseudomonas sp. MYb115]QXN50982.1 restriction endonuclease-like protein [Pseudomonas fluorescens]WSO25299.1 DUF2357 domain-containing protein [Pseudomonas fluorescens]